MHVAELIEIALASSDSRRVKVVTLEPVELAVETVSAVSQLIAELVENAIAFSEEGDDVRVTGLFDEGAYLITVSDRGIGLPEHLMNAMNRVLADPSLVTGSSGPGVAVIARLAARHGIRVRLVPGVPGTTARITIPSRLVIPIDEPVEPEAEQIEIHPRAPTRQLAAILREKAEEEFFAPFADDDDLYALASLSQAPSTGSAVVEWSDEARQAAEDFLDNVFAPMVGQPGMTERPPSHTGPNGRGPGRETASVRPESPLQREREATVTTLRRRVPGENFSPVEDEPSTMAAERAVDIRSALTRYSEGRGAAERARPESPNILDEVTPGG